MTLSCELGKLLPSGPGVALWLGLLAASFSVVPGDGLHRVLQDGAGLGTTILLAKASLFCVLLYLVHCVVKYHYLRIQTVPLVGGFHVLFAEG